MFSSVGMHVAAYRGMTASTPSKTDPKTDHTEFEDESVGDELDEVPGWLAVVPEVLVVCVPLDDNELLPMICENIWNAV